MRPLISIIPLLLLISHNLYAVITPGSVADGTEGINYPSVTFTSDQVRAGDPSIRWKTLNEPPGITIDNKGKYVGKPTKAGNYSVTISVSIVQGSRLILKDSISISHSINSTVAPVINQIALPRAKFDARYQPTAGFRLTATGGVPYPSNSHYPSGYKWEAITDGNEFKRLPAGMNLSSAGVISGVPTSLAPKPASVQTYFLKVKITDLAGKSDIKTFTLIVDPADPPEIVTQCPLPEGLELFNYTNFTLRGIKGKPPYSWSIDPLGNFAPGLRLDNKTGLISGKPSRYGTYNFTLVLRDANGFAVNRTCSINIRPAPEIIVKPIFQCAVVGGSACEELEARGGGQPYTWAATGLPGITINATSASKARICGNFTLAGNYIVSVTARDGTGRVDIEQFTFQVRPSLELKSSCPLEIGLQNSPYSTYLSADGGKLPYAWVLIPPDRGLPPGLTLNSTTGQIAGTPTSSGNYTFAYKVTDSCGNSVNKTCSINIYPALTCNKSLNLPCFSVKPFTLQIVADNDFSLFAGNNSSISRIIYQNNSSWGFQVSAASSLNFELQDNEDSFYVLAMNAGGPGDISGRIGATNIADLVENNKIKKSLDISAYLNSYSASEGSIEAGTYNVTLGEAQNARNQLGDSAWANPSINFSNSVITLNPYAYSSKQNQNVGFDLPSYKAVFFKFSGADVSTFPDTVISTVSGGKPPYIWDLLPLDNSGKILPDGIGYEISANGTQLILKGAVTESGTFSFISRVIDSLGNTCSQNHTITVNPKLEITNTCPLPNGTKGTDYSANLTSTGGKPSFTWALVPLGVGLPPGLTLNASSGRISGTPTAVGNFTFTIKVTDACGTAITKNCTIPITNPEGTTLECFAHMSGILMSDKRAGVSDKIYQKSQYSSIVPEGDYPNNSLAFPDAIDSTFDSLAIGRNVRVIIYEEPNFSGTVLLDQEGPALIFNNIWNNNAYPHYVAIFNQQYTDPTLKDTYPVSRRFWSNSNMHTWVNGSTRVLCNNNSENASPTTSHISNASIIGLLPAYLMVGESIDIKSLSQHNPSFQKNPEKVLIGKTEVTNRDYNDFLNAIAKTDATSLYNPLMANIGIQKTFYNGTASYMVDSASENYPVAYVSWFDSARYANWLANGKPSGTQNSTTTEDGAYNMKSSFIVRNSINPNTGAPPTFWLLNESEWYTSAYLKSDGTSLWVYPTQSNTAPDSTGANLSNFANFGGAFGETTPVGFFDQSPGPFGTFDQAGNVREWTETMDTSLGSPMRIIRGGSWADPVDSMRADESHISDPSLEDDKTGFRIGGAP
jgi:formylglycine-generating enzyme required for sulfatase activity